ncbi:MAG: glycosyltransferase family 4 protein [bacterium]
MPDWGWIAIVVVTFIVVVTVSSWLAGRIRSLAVQSKLLDVPNERSSHAVPVPRIGGLAIVTVVLTGILALALAIPLQVPWLWTLVISGSMIVGIGLVEDLFGVRKRVRLLIHVLAGFVIVLYIGSHLEIIFPKSLELTGAPALALITLYVVWNINSYNFMDGIDGLAGGQAVFIGLSAGTIAAINGNLPLAAVYLLIAAASTGYLRWNWHPAKIFMGDLCSGFLGVTFAVTSLWGKLTETVPLGAFLILMAVFYTDSTWTTFRRLLVGENITLAHRDFAFHHAIRAGHSHARVTTAIMLIDVFWLLPLAVIAVVLGDNRSIPVLIGAYLPVFAAVLYWKAGKRLEQADSRNVPPKRPDDAEDQA